MPAPNNDRPTAVRIIAIATKIEYRFRNKKYFVPSSPDSVGSFP